MPPHLGLLAATAAFAPAAVTTNGWVHVAHPQMHHMLPLMPVTPIKPSLASERSQQARAHRACSPRMLASEPTPAERVFATLPYFLPFIDGFQYGIYVFNNVPGGLEFAKTVLPFVIAFNSLPFAGIITFIGLSVFTRPSSGLSRFVRFNIQQALVLDILLIVPSLFSSLSGAIPSSVAIIGSNFVFYVMVRARSSRMPNVWVLAERPWSTLGQTLAPVSRSRAQ